jgi:hypothetical protein
MERTSRRIGGKMSDQNLPDELKGTNLAEMKELVDGCVTDYVKALGGGKASGTRVRKAMLKVKELALAIRKEILDKRG